MVMSPYEWKILEWDEKPQWVPVNIKNNLHIWTARPFNTRCWTIETLVYQYDVPVWCYFIFERIPQTINAPHPSSSFFSHRFTIIFKDIYHCNFPPIALLILKKIIWRFFYYIQTALYFVCIPFLRVRSLTLSVRHGIKSGLCDLISSKKGSNAPSL